MTDAGPLLCAPDQKARLEAENGVDQIDHITDLVTAKRIGEIRETQVLDFHKLAVKGIYPCGGTYRTATMKVHIAGSGHKIPEPAFVQHHVLDLLDRVKASRREAPAIECAAYALWRLNWIHPFAGGNGRTARALLTSSFAWTWG